MSVLCVGFYWSVQSMRIVLLVSSPNSFNCTVRYLRLKKKGILQVVLGNGHLQPAKYRVGIDGRLCLQKGWKEFVIDSGLKSEQVVVLNFFELEDRTIRITFDVIG